MKKASHMGLFAHHHENQPAPFNPDFIPGAKEAWIAAVKEVNDAEDSDPEHWMREYRAEMRKAAYESIKKKRGLKTVAELGECKYKISKR